ncbi:MAG: hypothetical protein M1493_14225 [Firmicutes bacterium]|nr:hypothetical protein [Bacillota bacterium]
MTRGDDPEAAHVFRWINATISNAKAMIDGPFHGSGRAHQQLFYLDEFAYRLNRRGYGTRIAGPSPDASQPLHTPTALNPGKEKARFCRQIVGINTG